MGSYTYVYDGAPHHRGKTRWMGSLTFVYNWHPLHHQRKRQSWKGFAFTMHDIAFSADGQPPVAVLWYPPHERDGFYLGADSYRTRRYALSPPDPFFAQG